MLVLSNQATAAAYPAQGSGCSLGPSYNALSLALSIFNATAYVQLILPDDFDRSGAVQGWHYGPEFALTPQAVTFVGALGFRARNFASGAPATVFAQVYERFDPQTPGGVPLTGTVSGGQVSTAGLPAGTVIAYAGATAPSGFVFCDGSTYDGTTTTYAALWAAIGPTYGGIQSAFQVPDIRGRVVVAKGTHADVSALGNSDGVAVANRRPAHNHTASIDVYGVGGGGARVGVGQTGGGLQGTVTVGVVVGPGGTTAQDEPAFLVLNYLISLG